MVRSVLKWVIILGVVLLIVFWVLAGGFGDIASKANSLNFSIGNLISGSSTLSSFTLPGAPAMPQIPIAYESDGSGGSGSGAIPNGANSPYAGQVVLAEGAAPTQTPSGQYVIISSSPGAPSIDIAGWTLQSTLTGARATIPQAASPFLVGSVNAVGSVMLRPGGIAYVVTGASPVGASFSENMCTGYLGTLQPFVPALPLSCPSPTSEIPNNAQNQSSLGASCMQYVSQIPPCMFPSGPPSGLSSACVSTIQTRLSYNGCVAAHRNQPGFSHNAWRLYLASGIVLWAAEHDVVRLLDKEGRLVSVINY
ncbi:MAG TPA: hypothetical protein VN495_01130 [Candidatus Paceibacterota bacterium]|nr:hypothetical protein [Candidatus Paceibacterota bacterium]